MEWRRWSSGKPADSDAALSRKHWLSVLKPFLNSRSVVPSVRRLSVLREDEVGTAGGTLGAES